MTTFDPKLPVQISSGLPVRIICTDLKGRYPIVALVTQGDGTETVHNYDATGRYADSSWSPPLSNVPKKEFINIWRNDDGSVACTYHPYGSCAEAERASRIVKSDYLAIGIELGIL